MLARPCGPEQQHSVRWYFLEMQFLGLLLRPTTLGSEGRPNTTGLATSWGCWHILSSDLRDRLVQIAEQLRRNNDRKTIGSRIWKMKPVAAFGTS